MRPGREEKSREEKRTEERRGQEKRVRREQNIVERNRTEHMFFSYNNQKLKRSIREQDDIILGR